MDPSPAPSAAPADREAKAVAKRRAAEGIFDEIAPAKKSKVILIENLKKPKEKSPGFTLLPGDPDYNYSKYLNPDVRLMAHQNENVDRFIKTFRDPNCCNSLLIADDPGLGKSLSALACVSALRSIVSDKDEWLKTIIIAPKSVLLQWKAEILKFTKTPEDKVVIGILDPSARFCLFSYEAISYQFKQQFEKDVDEKGMLCYRRRATVNVLSLPFLAHHFKFAVFDEIHKTRNDKTLTHFAMNRVAPFGFGQNYPRLGLSGTPLVNRVRDIWAIGQVLKFNAPFDDVKFFESMDKESQNFEKTVFVRHAKADVLELPRLTTHTIRLEMEAEEHEVMAKYIKELVDAFEAAKNRTDTFMGVLSALTRIRQVAVHPGLPSVTIQFAARRKQLKAAAEAAEMEEEAALDAEAAAEDGVAEEEEDEEDEEKEEDEVSDVDSDVASESDDGEEEEAVEEQEFGLEELLGAGEDEQSIKSEVIRDLAMEADKSAKMRWLKDNMRKITGDFSKGALIYSSFSTPLEMIQIWLKTTFEIDAEMFVGGISASKRAASIERFLAGETRVLLLTYGSGGVGLNLCPAGQVVIHLDIPWAPASIIQATDRVHRKGTDKPINEYVLQSDRSTDQFILDSIHVVKKGHIGKLNRVAASLKGLRTKTGDTAMNKENVQKMLAFFERAARHRAPPKRLDL